MRALRLPTPNWLAVAIGLPALWVAPWFAYGIAVVVFDFESSQRLDTASMDWWYWGLLVTPLIAIGYAFSQKLSLGRSAGVGALAAACYAVLAITALLVVVSAWTLVDGPFLEGMD